MVNIRPATPSDVPQLFRVRTSVRENHQSEEELSELGVTRGSVSELLRSGEARAWCAEVDGVIVGFSMARQSQRDIFALFVLPGFEGRGIGTSLLGEAVEWLRPSGPNPIRLSTGRSTKAFDFYIKRGWHAVASPGNEDPNLEFAG